MRSPSGTTGGPRCSIASTATSGSARGRTWDSVRSNCRPWSTGARRRVPPSSSTRTGSCAPSSRCVSCKRVRDRARRARSTDGIEIDPTPNGTAFVEDGALGEGDVYTAVSYAPNPTAAEMRRAPDAYAPALAHHTAIGLPRACRGARFERPFQVPLRGGGGERRERAAVRLSRSSYGEVFELARRLTAGAPTTYDAVKAIEIHLQSSYDHVETSSSRPCPTRLPVRWQGRLLRAVLRAMALMLRMLGIPRGSPPGSARVAPTARIATWSAIARPTPGWRPTSPGSDGFPSIPPRPSPPPSSSSAARAVSAAGGEVVEARPRAAATRAPARWAGLGGRAVAVRARDRPAIGRGIALAVVRAPSPIAVRLGCRRGQHRGARGRPRAARLAASAQVHPEQGRGRDAPARCPSAAAYVASLRAVRFGPDGRPPRFPSGGACAGSCAGSRAGGRRSTPTSPFRRAPRRGSQNLTAAGGGSRPVAQQRPG